MSEFFTHIDRDTDPEQAVVDCANQGSCLQVSLVINYIDEEPDQQILVVDNVKRERLELPSARFRAADLSGIPAEHVVDSIAVRLGLTHRPGLGLTIVNDSARLLPFWSVGDVANPLRTTYAEEVERYRHDPDNTDAEDIVPREDMPEFTGFILNGSVEYHPKKAGNMTFSPRLVTMTASQATHKMTAQQEQQPNYFTERSLAALRAHAVYREAISG